MLWDSNTSLTARYIFLILTKDPDEGFASLFSEILGDFEFSLFQRPGPPHPPQTGPRLPSQLWEGFLSSLQARLGLGGVG